MKTNEQFPSWILDSISNYRIQDWIDNPEIISVFIDNISELSLLLNKAPDDATFFELRKISPEVAASAFGDSGVGLLHTAESASQAWIYAHIYKLRSYCNGMLSMLEAGNLLVAASCARGMFEQISCFHYFFKRIQSNFEKGNQLSAMQRKNIKKGKIPPSSWQEKVYENIFNHIHLCLRSVQGTDFDWSKFLSNNLSNANLEFEGNSDSKGKSSKRLHTNEAIRDLPEITKGYMYWYSALCDFVHPNVGSYWMVLDKRESVSKDCFDTTLTDKPVNADAIIYFMIVISNSLSSLLELTINEIARATNISKEYQSMAIIAKESMQTRH